MALENYRDISVGGSDVGSGFQFEFSCESCGRRWKSPFKPYRMGQITGLLTRFAFLFTDFRNAGRATGNFADMGSGGAKDKALEEALERARTMYTECGGCRHAVCHDCWDERQNSCVDCVTAAREGAANAQRQQAEAQAAAAAVTCPSCQCLTASGRFCSQCGYDMASAYKSCPTCGSMVARNARFCGDCGHGF
jgi:hypothetical protein